MSALLVGSFSFLSQLFGSDTISLAVWQELVCMSEDLSREKIVVYFVMLSSFSNGVFSRCQGKGKGEAHSIGTAESIPPFYIYPLNISASHCLKPLYM